MGWRDFYLVCFVLGFALSVVAFLSGTLHLPLGRGLHGLHLPHVHGAAAPGPHAAGHAGDGVSPFNVAGLMAFLAWFGGVGYLLTSRGALPRLIVLTLSAIAGIAGALVVFGFLSRFLLRHERPLDPADYVMVGVLGRVTVPIREGGTGEIVYSQEGTRRCAGARSDAGGPIARGSEVVVTRYDRGIAYVRLWEELTNGALSVVGSRSREERSGR
jgi:membrane protein implicated in regulation of membrane protease activity